MGYGQPKLLYHNDGIIKKIKLQTNIYVQIHTIYKQTFGYICMVGFQTITMFVYTVSVMIMYL